jgi:hypothetical protein
MRILFLTIVAAVLAACTSVQPERPGTNAATLTLSSTTDETAEPAQ